MGRLSWGALTLALLSAGGRIEIRVALRVASLRGLRCLEVCVGLHNCVASSEVRVTLIRVVSEIRIALKVRIVLRVANSHCFEDPHCFEGSHCFAGSRCFEDSRCFGDLHF